jgi:hypothetical protein
MSSRNITLHTTRKVRSKYNLLAQTVYFERHKVPTPSSAFGDLFSKCHITIGFQKIKEIDVIFAPDPTTQHIMELHLGPCTEREREREMGQNQSQSQSSWQPEAKKVGPQQKAAEKSRQQPPASGKRFSLNRYAQIVL